jgi:hypothetical protein
MPVATRNLSDEGCCSVRHQRVSGTSSVQVPKSSGNDEEGGERVPYAEIKVFILRMTCGE